MANTNCRSLGEHILRELTVHGDKVAIVSELSRAAIFGDRRQVANNLSILTVTLQIDAISERQISYREIIEGSLKMAAYFKR